MNETLKQNITKLLVYLVPARFPFSATAIHQNSPGSYTIPAFLAIDHQDFRGRDVRWMEIDMAHETLTWHAEDISGHNGSTYGRDQGSLPFSDDNLAAIFNGLKGCVEAHIKEELLAEERKAKQIKSQHAIDRKLSYILRKTSSQ